MAEFETLLVKILSPDKNLREASEKIIKDFVCQSAESALIALINSILSTSEQVSVLSAILIQKLFVEGGAISKVNLKSAEAAKNSLLGLINSNISINAKKKIGDILYNFAIFQKWEVELLGYLTNWSISDNPNLQELSLYLFSCVSFREEFFSIITANLSSLAEILYQGLQRLNTTIQLNAALTLFHVMSVVQEDKLHYFSICFDKSLEVLKTSAQSLSFSLQENLPLGDLADLTEKYPAIWIAKMPELINLVTILAKEPKNSVAIRIAAVEIYIVLIKSKEPHAKDIIFLQEAAALGFSLMAEPENALDYQAWANDITDIYTEGVFTVGFSLLGALKKIPEAQSFIHNLTMAHLESSHWLHQNIGLTTYSLIANPDFSSLKNLVQTNGRLQWSFLQTLAIVSAENSIAENQRCLVTEYLLAFLNHQEPKILKQALRSLSLFLTSLIRDDAPIDFFLPYMSRIIESLFVLLGNDLLLAYALDPLSILITYAGSFFTPYTQKFLPGLIIILKAPSAGVNQQIIRAECIRCIGRLVENSDDQSETEKLFSEIWKIWATAEEDPGKIAIIEVLPQFFYKMKTNFVKFLPEVVPELVQRLENDIDIHISENKDKVPGYDQVNVSIRGLGDKIIVINTTKLQSKIFAAQTLRELTKALSSSLGNFLFPIIKSMAGLISFSFNQTIRNNALKTLSLLPLCDSNEQYLIFITPIYTEALQKCIKKHKDTLAILQSLQKFLESFGNVTQMGFNNAQSLSLVLSQVLIKNIDVKNSLLSEYKIVSLRGNSKKSRVLETDAEICNASTVEIMEIVSVLLRSFKEQFKPIFAENFQGVFGELLYKQEIGDNEILTSLCVFCDYVEYTHDIIVKGDKCPILEQFIKFCFNSNDNIRETAAAGIGYCAESSTEAFKAYLGPSIDALKFIVGLENARSSLLQSSESAIGALIKIGCLYSPEIIGLWIDWLPLKTEIKEARQSHAWFLTNFSKISALEPKAFQIVSLMKQANPEFFDENSRNILRNMV
ncbi:hypothetical protein SteCoe_33475 [Stentor coeruleus]|uniref:IPO4/5-like TPR repeats domain-containing protein n=1 Tax=Stentor coeruleus TaxID=5963 RepID=A0A1R2AWP0_9CILI|nr:hypothetical protein SteCoe_33475 [Stentor coeruleus]